MEGKALKSFLVALALVWGGAYAAVAVPMPPAAPAAKCTAPWLETHYRAKVEKGSDAGLELTIGNRADGTWATLSRGSECLSICRVEPEWRSQASRPDSIQLQCANIQFDALSAQAVLLWPGIEAAHPILRFGTWLQGYRDFALSVKVDRYSDGVIGRRPADQQRLVAAP